MTTTGVFWPTKDEYDIAIAKWTETVWDPGIRRGILAYDKMGICRFGGANLYVCMYRIDDWMVRCFCSNPSHPTPVDIQERYLAISHFSRIHASQVSALIPVIYIQHGITVGKRTLPIVKMPFLAGCPSLGEFIMDHYQDRAMMQLLSDAWLCMMRELEVAPMAHGDLDLSNVLVQQHGTTLTLKLIDYDNMWIPELAGHNQTEYGHVNFQHPNFLPPRPRPYNVEMDRFSALVIYISLRVLVSHPQLYEEWGADESERLLLSERDYQSASLVGSRIMRLRELSSPELNSYFDELNASLCQGHMPRRLSDIASSANFVSKPSIRQPVQPQRSAIAPAPAISVWRDAVYKASPLFTPSPSIPTWGMEATMPEPEEAQHHEDKGVNRSTLPLVTLKEPKGKRRATIITVVCVLVLIILATSIVFALLLNTRHHSDSVAPAIDTLLAAPAYRLVDKSKLSFGSTSAIASCMYSCLRPTPLASPTPSPTATPSPTPAPTPTATPSPTPAPTPTPSATVTPSPLPTPSPTPSAIATPSPIASPTPFSTPLPTATAKFRTPVPRLPTPTPKYATSTPTRSSTPISGAVHTGNTPPPDGGNSTQGTSLMEELFTSAAVVLAVLAFMLYLVSQRQASLFERVVSLIVPISLLRRFDTRKEP